MVDKDQADGAYDERMYTDEGLDGQDLDDSVSPGEHPQSSQITMIDRPGTQSSIF